MILSFALTAALLGPANVGAANVSKAEKLYEQAKYEAALKALGPSCIDAARPASCERIRAFVLKALGRPDAARAAFDRMVVRDPGASLDDSVAPRLRELFAEAKSTVTAVMDMRLELTADDEDFPVLLEVKSPDGISLSALTVHIDITASGDYASVPLQPTSFVWTAEKPWTDEPARAVPYFMVAELPSGTSVPIGSFEEPLQVRALTGKGDGVRSVSESDGFNELEEDGEEEDEEYTPRRRKRRKGLPPWAKWTIGGGSVAVVGIIILGITLGGGGGSGSIPINFQFEDDP